MRTSPIVRLALLWALLVAFMAAARALSPLIAPAAGELPLLDATGQPYTPASPGLIGTATSLGFLLIGAWLTGRIFNALSLPRVSGYLLFGVFCGPELAAVMPGNWPALVPREQLGYLRLVDDLAIALIALMAGGEIRLSFISARLRQITTIVSIEMIFVGVGVTALVLALMRLNPLTAGMTWPIAAVVSLIIGTVMIANSPAIVIAMIKETGAKGLFASTALTVTVCKDLVLIVLFAVVMSIALAVLPGLAGATSEAASSGPDTALTAQMAWHLVGSIAMGALIGALMTFPVRRMGERLGVFIIGAGFAIALISRAMELEPLLVALTAGLLQANLWPGVSRRLFNTLEELSLPVYCVFFAVAGAGIRIDALLDLWPIALAVVTARLGMVWLGTHVGVKLARLDPPARTWLWTALVPQAGVSIALATQVGRSLHEYEWAAQLTSLLLAVIAIHELAGPPLMRLGIARCGELAADVEPSPEQGDDDRHALPSDV